MLTVQKYIDSDHKRGGAWGKIGRVSKPSWRGVCHGTFGSGREGEGAGGITPERRCRRKRSRAPRVHRLQGSEAAWRSTSTSARKCSDPGHFTRRLRHAYLFLAPVSNTEVTCARRLQRQLEAVDTWVQGHWRSRTRQAGTAGWWSAAVEFTAVHIPKSPENKL
jgi:hypothetical protein